jgi:hypothetical protein
MTMADVVMILTAVAALFLAVRGYRSHGQSFERTAWMAVIWVVIIAVLAFVIQRFAP